MYFVLYNVCLDIPPTTVQFGRTFLAQNLSKSSATCYVLCCVPGKRFSEQNLLSPVPCPDCPNYFQKLQRSA